MDSDPNSARAGKQAARRPDPIAAAYSYRHYRCSRSKGKPCDSSFKWSDLTVGASPPFRENDQGLAGLEQVEREAKSPPVGPVDIYREGAAPTDQPGQERHLEELVPGHPAHPPGYGQADKDRIEVGLMVRSDEQRALGRYI